MSLASRLRAKDESPSAIDKKASDLVDDMKLILHLESLNSVLHHTCTILQQSLHLYSISPSQQLKQICSLKYLCHSYTQQVTQSRIHTTHSSQRSQISSPY